MWLRIMAADASEGNQLLLDAKTLAFIPLFKQVTQSPVAI